MTSVAIFVAAMVPQKTFEMLSPKGDCSWLFFTRSRTGLYNNLKESNTRQGASTQTLSRVPQCEMSRFMIWYDKSMIESDEKSFEQQDISRGSEPGAGRFELYIHAPTHLPRKNLVAHISLSEAGLGANALPRPFTSLEANTLPRPFTNASGMYCSVRYIANFPHSLVPYKLVPLIRASSRDHL